MTTKHDEELFVFWESDLRRNDDDDEGQHIISRSQRLLERLGKTPRALCGLLLTGSVFSGKLDDASPETRFCRKCTEIDRELRGDG